MADEKKIDENEVEQKGRRAFVKTSAAVAVTAPAVAMLLTASTKPAAAQGIYNAINAHILDDFTFGNDHEDIDAIKSGTNLTGFGKPAQDDHNVAPA